MPPATFYIIEKFEFDKLMHSLFGCVLFVCAWSTLNEMNYDNNYTWVFKDLSPTPKSLLYE